MNFIQKGKWGAGCEKMLFSAGILHQVYRKLTSHEIEILERNQNDSSDWDQVHVTAEFHPELIRYSSFTGPVYIGKLIPGFLERDGFQASIGIYHASIAGCILGNLVSLCEVKYLENYVIGDECILFNLDEMRADEATRFGAGIAKSAHCWLEVGNENGARKILPFVGMLSADAFMCSKFRADKLFQQGVIRLTEHTRANSPGKFGQIGTQTILKHCHVLHNVDVGTHAFVQGANKLENVTVQSTAAEPTVIDSDIQIVDGIIGPGNRVLHGVTALGVVTGSNCQLKTGVRVMQTFLGDNSTISCCEVLSNLIFPFHEQHHNNSFLIAATIQGQSNIAAGATIGSNHNSRAADGEILARRGFWAGLSTSFKHNCKFASFTLAAKGDYPYEMNISLPFSLVSLKDNSQQLQILPAYWLLYNMYALARNSWKFKARDKRKVKRQNIEFDYLAPDTAEEMLTALGELQWAVGMSAFTDAPPNNEQAREQGKKLLDANYPVIKSRTISLPNQVNRGYAIILKIQEAYDAYYEMLLFYCLRTIIEALAQRQISLTQLLAETPRKADRKWWNVGGQIMADSDLQEIMQKIKNNEFENWDAVHLFYDEKWENYPAQKLSHALQTLELLLETPLDSLSAERWKNLFINASEIQDQISRRVRESREKDFIDPFLQTMFESPEEMRAVIGDINDVVFVKEMDELAVSFREVVMGVITKSLKTV